MPTASYAVAILAFTLPLVTADEGQTDTPEMTVVQVKDLELKVPDSWKKAESASRMRLATYEIPAVDGDSDNGELTIFSFGGGGGGVSDNIKRWRDQFAGDERTLKITKGMAADNTYYLANITGTYNKSVGPPILRRTEAKEGYRMLGVILNLEGKGVYFLKLTGPDATIKAEAKKFRMSFGGHAESEEDYEI